MSYIRSMRSIVLSVAYATALLVAPHSAIGGSSAASSGCDVQCADLRALRLPEACR